MAREESEKGELLATYGVVVFLDMDDTVWELVDQNGSDQWLSKGARTDEDILGFSLDEVSGIVKRENDGLVIGLKDGVVELLEMFFEKKIPVGIVSDNRWKDVEMVANLLGIWKYFDQKISHIQLYDDARDGPCNKGEIIQQLLTSLGVLGATRCVIFVDDKSKYRDDPVFSRPLMVSMVTFVQSPRDRFPIEEVKSSLLDF